MKTSIQRPVKTAGYSFGKQRARRAERKSAAEWRASQGVDKPFGLRQLILSAPSVQSLSDRLESGSDLIYASEKTRRRWGRAAGIRLKQLSKN